MVAAIVGAFNVTALALSFVVAAYGIYSAIDGNLFGGILFYVVAIAIKACRVPLPDDTPD